MIPCSRFFYTLLTISLHLLLPIMLHRYLPISLHYYLPTTIAQHMIALSLFKDQSVVMRALNDWYGQSNKVYEIWAEKYPVIITEVAKIACFKQNDWCKAVKINFTPTIFVNGYRLPELYQLEDLKYLIN